MKYLLKKNDLIEKHNCSTVSCLFFIFAHSFHIIINLNILLIVMNHSNLKLNKISR